MAEKITREEIIALLIVFLAAFGVWFAMPKAALAQFGFASQVRDAVLGGNAPFPAQITAAKLEVYASILGMNAASATTISSYLLFASPFALAICAVALYLSLRVFGFGKSVSALSSLVFAFSFSAIPLLPGMLSAEGIAAMLFSLLLFSFAFYAKKESLPALVFAIVFAILAGFCHPAFAIAGILFVLILGEMKLSDKKTLVTRGVLLAAFLVSALLSSQAAGFAVNGMLSSFLLSPFLVAAASCAVVLSLFGAKKEYAVILLAGIFLAGFSPFAASFAFAIAAAAGISEVAKETNKTALLACAFFAAFFLVLGLFPYGADAKVAIASSFLIATVSPLLLFFYEYNGKPFFAAFAAVLLASAAFCAVLFQFPMQRSIYPKYVDADLQDALLFLNEKGAKTVGTLERHDAAGFYLPDAKMGNNDALLEYLKTGKTASGADYLLLSLSSLGNVSEDFEIYSYSGNYTGNGRAYAIFSSGYGIITRELGQDGTIMLKDGELRDAYGTYYGSVPLNRMMELQNGSRMVVLAEGSQPPNFIKIYTGQEKGEEQVAAFGSYSVFKVK